MKMFCAKPYPEQTSIALASLCLGPHGVGLCPAWAEKVIFVRAFSLHKQKVGICSICYTVFPDETWPLSPAKPLCLATPSAHVELSANEMRDARSTITWSAYHWWLTSGSAPLLSAVSYSGAPVYPVCKVRSYFTPWTADVYWSTNGSEVVSIRAMGAHLGGTLRRGEWHPLKIALTHHFITCSCPRSVNAAALVVNERIPGRMCVLPCPLERAVSKVPVASLSFVSLRS